MKKQHTSIHTAFTRIVTVRTRSLGYKPLKITVIVRRQGTSLSHQGDRHDTNKKKKSKNKTSSDMPPVPDAKKEEVDELRFY